MIIPQFEMSVDKVELTTNMTTFAPEMVVTIRIPLDPVQAACEVTTNEQFNEQFGKAALEALRDKIHAARNIGGV